MKKNLIKLILTVLIISIIVVVLFLFSIILYGIKFWPDVKNYINANTTIKRIPTITELNTTIIDEVDVSTTTDSNEITSNLLTDTFDVNNDYYLSLDDVQNDRRKRNAFMKTYVDIEEYFETNNEDIDTNAMYSILSQDKLISNLNEVNLNNINFIFKMKPASVGSAYEVISTNIFPWLAAIFTRIEYGDQFNYYCDGALLSEDVVITAARCIRGMNSSATPADLVVLLGKTSLHTMTDGEKVAKVKEIHIHENYTTGTENDVAVLLLQDAVELSESIQPAKLRPLQVYDAAYTTGWAYSGELSLIHFKNNNSGGCDQHTDGNRTICADYDDDVSVCPSYGGLYVVRSEGALYLHGIRTGDPTDRLLCSNRSIIFTVLQSFSHWISKFCPLINSIST